MLLCFFACVCFMYCCGHSCLFLSILLRPEFFSFHYVSSFPRLPHSSPVQQVSSVCSPALHTCGSSLISPDLLRLSPQLRLITNQWLSVYSESCFLCWLPDCLLPCCSISVCSSSKAVFQMKAASFKGTATISVFTLLKLHKLWATFDTQRGQKRFIRESPLAMFHNPLLCNSLLLHIRGMV